MLLTKLLPRVDIVREYSFWQSFLAMATYEDDLG